MKIEKLLKQDIEKMDKKILDEGQDIKTALMAKYCVETTASPKSKPMYKRKSFIVTLSCVLACLLTLGVVLPLTLDNKPTYYLKENEVTRPSTLDDISNFIEMQINEKNFVLTQITVTSDSISGDTLYYSLKFDSTMVFPCGNVNFVINKNYNLYENDEITESECVWNNYKVVYSISTSDAVDIPTIQVMGCVEHDQLRIYFSYTDIDLGEPVTPDSFLDFLFV